MSLTDVNNKRDELNEALDDYIDAVLGQAPTETVDDLKTTTITKTTDYSKAVGVASKTETDVSLFSDAQLMDFAKRDYTQMVLRYGSLVKKTTRITVGKSQGKTGTQTFIRIGYWRDLTVDAQITPIPLANSGGSITKNKLYGDIVIALLTPYYLQGGSPEYGMTLGVYGGQLIRDFFKSLTILGVGTFLPANVLSFSNTGGNGNMTTWKWTISKAIYDQIEARGYIDFIIEPLDAFNQWSKNIAYFGIRVSGGTINKECRDYRDRYPDLYQDPYTAMGTFIRGASIKGIKISMLKSSSNTSGAIDPVNNYLALIMNQKAVAQDLFGAIRIPGVGTFSAYKVSAFDNSAGRVDTAWQWQWWMGYPYTNPAYYTKFTGWVPYEIDDRPFNKTHTLTPVLHAASDWEYRGFYTSGATVKGSISPATYANRTIFNLHLRKQGSYADPQKYLCQLTLDGYDLPQNLFEYVEIKGVGRFYSSDVVERATNATSQTTVWRWVISTQLLADMAVTGTLDVQIV